jgi:spore maturation protein CgeB
MRLAIFGLTVSSSWGNGHATLWRGLINALAAQGHAIEFFERDVPYYASHRDLNSGHNFTLKLYADWSTIAREAHLSVEECDAAIVTSYCPDGRAASDLVLQSQAIKVFYDLDAAVTLEQLNKGVRASYIPDYGLSGFDLVLSYVGGRALDDLQRLLGARRVAPLYGSVDPDLHRPVPRSKHYDSDLSYLGTYASDRQRALEKLFLEPAQRLPKKKFLLGGAQYPEDFPWTENIWFVRHVPPAEHPAFYSSSRATLNVTRAAMASYGYCPSGRLFEAAACETPVVSDSWDGLDEFFELGRELLVTDSSADVVDALSRSAEDLQQVGRAARQRVLGEHTAWHRSRELLQHLEAVA